MPTLDITFCENKTCPKKGECGRNSCHLPKINDPRYQYLSHGLWEMKDGDCEGFFPLTKKKSKQNKGE